MYIQRINTKQNGKTYPGVYLCRSYRENGKQKREILATLTKWPPQIVEGLEKLLKGKAIFDIEDLKYEQGKSFGALWVLLQLAKQTGIVKALGSSDQAKFALLQIIARCIDPSSRLHIANFWKEHYAIEEVLKIPESFTEDHLYGNLDWLAERQTLIEKKLFDYKYPNGKINELYLYDVTSSYFEGTQNELSAYGYNRDKKKGKKQIVIGLLCDSEGDPISVEVFKGNTSDLTTFYPQLKKLKEEFGVQRVVMIGDKGMIKSKQIDQVNQIEWNYITSITKKQILSLIKQEVFQMELFDTNPIEVREGEIRYILRRNPVRASQIQANRSDKIEGILNCVERENQYLKEHPKATVEKAKERILSKMDKINLTKLFEMEANERSIRVSLDKEALKQEELLDGCYVIKTELEKEVNTKTVHDSYKGLAKAEHAFRTIKTGIEEIRPIFVRKESRTRGHVFVCMLAYKLIHLIRKHIDDEMNQMPTIEEVLASLNAIQYSTHIFQGKRIKVLPTKLNETQDKILKTLNLQLPSKVYAK